MNNTPGLFQILLSRVMQEPIFGPMLFNIFINNLFSWVRGAGIIILQIIILYLQFLQFNFNLECKNLKK